MTIRARDYHHLDVQAYVAAMRSATIATRQELEVAVDAAVESVVRQRLPPDVTAAEAATEIEAAISFDVNLRRIDVRRGCRTPEDYATAMADRLDAR
jgi:hypothetical protein